MVVVVFIIWGFCLVWFGLGFFFVVVVGFGGVVLGVVLCVLFDNDAVITPWNNINLILHTENKKGMSPCSVFPS